MRIKETTNEREPLDIMGEIRKMSIEELLTLRNAIDEILKEKQQSERKEYEFEVEVTGDPRKWKPFVAKLTVDTNGGLKREFYNLQWVRDYAEELIEWRKKGGDQWK